ncbi:Flavinator of succinate dehydrogenase-domain-containing protein [Dunaliella salina]|uniref:Flavinator of succinate dehydrogenase-domain-containing protein n=1 Tax=Dunaliella salina TaxID=3046 RepID=A0ABQ7GT57_DUNSA|nr:Flavinator of succinate dehydrogenase-domain-containing protein [Dunaliella salina]|eukprot:KAF5837783.1 Flavinator of succinate dehydrogenase-domain-containing protein [Dunaliella salina]
MQPLLLARCVRGGASLQPFSSQSAALLSSLATNAHLSPAWEPSRLQLSSSLAKAQIRQNVALCQATFSSSSSSSSSSSGQLNEAQAQQAMANKLLYRSKQRGFLELDLLMGLWAEENIPKMDMRAMEEFSAVLDQENPDMFKWLTGQEQAPETMLANPTYMALLNDVQQQLSHKRDDRAVTPAGKEWSRGWDDLWKNPANKNVPGKDQ